MDGLVIGMRPDGSYMKMTKTDLYFVDRYGNEECLSDFGVMYKQNSPTYDELYNHWLKTKNKSKGEVTMNNKFTMELVWHNCKTCPPEEDRNLCLYASNGKSVFRVIYHKDSGWCDIECQEYIPDELLDEFWWADINQTVRGVEEFYGKD